jgi:protein O-GlcNAc transferase
MGLQIRYEYCPLCGGQGELAGSVDCTRHLLWHEPIPRTLEWMSCKTCSHVYTRYYWTADGLAEIFKNSHQNQLVGGDPDVNRAIWAPVIDRSINLLGGTNNLLARETAPTWMDVGCGNGALAMTAADFGFNAIGLDARADTVSRIKALGFNAQQSDFMDVLAEDGSVDVISMMDVLEHIPYPITAIDKARSMLCDDGGLLIISLPDLSSSSWRIMDSMQANPYWMEIEHHHNLSRYTLISLLNKYGFSIHGFSVPYRYKAQMEIYAMKTKPNRS